ncbi:uncharacterized protein PGTG_22728 [Puccinia graminis f. sp. tritici CRL 75-36-700-3]|uniref:Tet-like 2OG-Fe(II) oxygenase domain-containing protein n=1 Tax=Puccinia graminis f. sp. tritici (strain CRL 75-36-700-3 / race SCCL) TaxID=418459 RepID=H6QVH4_PUCGT|nr:uncharacterized protein PGTG_22728 [Puccinia graminis f. sp. tritici CRL 75-36-700-3]EHS62957.1 hypothetical protein PGTG_22728 [Puccinia graminis f. sp. tritici CRL 75-36-700-3]
MKREYVKYDLYPVRHAKNASTEEVRKTHPTPEEFEAAETALLDRGQFTLIKDGRLVLYEKDVSVLKPGEKRKHKFIAYIEFTSSAYLTTEDGPHKLSTIQLENLSFLSHFLFQCRNYISTVQSVAKIFRGYMWTIGWRKSQTEGEMAGRYVDTGKISSDTFYYMENLMEAFRAGDIIHDLFHSIADTAVLGMKTLLKDCNLPGFNHLNLGNTPVDTDMASNLAFTMNEFSNRPHNDTDVSKHAFLFLTNVDKNTGEIQLNSHLDPSFQGPFFVFPDHRVAVDLRKLDGICRIVFAAGEFRHCTHNNQPTHKKLTSMGFSLQITKSCVDAFKKICNGFYDGKLTKSGKEYYIGDCSHTLKKIKEDHKKNL